MGCYNSVVINGPADKVWETLSNFHDLSWSANVVNKVDIKGDKGAHEIGARRVLNDAFHETLLSVNSDAKSFTYSIDEGPAVLASDNIAGYVGEVTVFPITENNTSFVLWTSRWDSAKEGDVAEFCNPIYQALLGDLKGHFS